MLEDLHITSEPAPACALIIDESLICLSQMTSTQLSGKENEIMFTIFYDFYNFFLDNHGRQWERKKQKIVKKKLYIHFLIVSPLTISVYVWRWYRMSLFNL